MRGWAKLLAVLLFAAWPSAAWCAGTLEIAPTTLDLTPGKAGLLYLANNGPAAAVIQLQTLDWTQNENANVLAPSETLIASPPFLRIAPGQRQIVRVLADEPGKHESEYRLLISELPNGADAGASVSVLLQFSVPVFAARAPAPPAPEWSAKAHDRKLNLMLHNGGASALKITAISLASKPIPCGLTYVLPGARHVWTVPSDNAASLHIAARDERSGTALDADIPVQR